MEMGSASHIQEIIYPARYTIHEDDSATLTHGHTDIRDPISIPKRFEDEDASTKQILFLMTEGKTDKEHQSLRMSEALKEQEEGHNKRKDPPTPSTSDDEEETGHAVRLDWRMDPEESLSDWKIEISVDGTILGTYHVHRATLSVGSKYFAGLFANQGLNEHETSTSHIEMEELAAENFPHMLDYLYSLWDNDEKPITAENAVALHFFGRYFEIRGLRKEVRTFWKKSMTPQQTGTYLEHAKLFHDDKVYDAVAEKCVGSLHAIKVNSHLMDVSDTKFWLAVLRENKGASNPGLSTLLSAFCSMNKEILSAETFLELTDKLVLPKLSVTAAMELLKLEKHFVPTSPSATDLSTLQERGLEVLSSCGDEDQQILVELQQHCKDLPPLVVSLMLQRSVAKLWDSNLKLQVASSCLPKEIIVANARGSSNGAYSLTSTLRENAPSYVKNGTDEGIFNYVLYLSLREDSQYNWCIAYMGENGFITVPIYRSGPVPKESSRLPPQTGWFVKQSSGRWIETDYCPILSFRFDNSVQF